MSTVGVGAARLAQRAHAVLRAADLMFGVENKLLNYTTVGFIATPSQLCFDQILKIK